MNNNNPLIGFLYYGGYLPLQYLIQLPCLYAFQYYDTENISSKCLSV